MTLKERWHSKESKIGRFLRRELTWFLAICSVVGGANEYLVLIPTEWVPLWIKELIPVAGLISFISGKLTTKKKEIDGEFDDQST